MMTTLDNEHPYAQKLSAVGFKTAPPGTQAHVQSEQLPPHLNLGSDSTALGTHTSNVGRYSSTQG